MAIPAKVLQICEDLVLSDENLGKVRDLLDHEINLGLGKETNAQATVKCFPTYVRSLPNGKESGKFLALDLGGTNFRVLLIDLEGNPCQTKMVSEGYIIPEAIKMAKGTDLFDHVASCLSKFMHEKGLEKSKIPLGFTFSFPCRQEGLTRGVLMTWTKGFKCSEVVGQDVVQLLHEAIKRRGDVEIDVVAVVNDTTGTLMNCAFKNPECRIGLIIGTGTNACYVEKLENVGLWNEDFNEPRQVVINTEWGAFGDNQCLEFIHTSYDKEVDKTSLNEGKQIFEKMISGMYMGDIACLLIKKLTKEGHLFRGIEEEIFKPSSFEAEYISEIEKDKVGEWKNCREILTEKFGVPKILVTDQDCLIVRHVCEVVSRRAAGLVSAGVATLLNKIGEEKAVVAVDGSVYRWHPRVHNLMTENIQKLVKPGMKFELMLSEDGSGRGAALVAAVAARGAQGRKSA